MSIHVKIYDTESIDDIAKKIYFDFDVNASCTVYGFVQNDETEELIPKGELVVAKIRWWYETENLGPSGSRVWKYRNKETNIGGPLAHKIFTWERRIVDKEPRYTIWRVQ